MKVSLTINATICTMQKRWTLPSWSLLELSKKAIYTIKVLYFRLRAATANSFFPINLTCLIVEKAFSIV